MSRENEYRVGIDERPLTNDEFERLKNGGSLYRRVTAPQRPVDADQRHSGSMSTMTEKAMSARNNGCTIWMRNKNWYRFDSKRNKCTLTEMAPKEARESFEQYKKINHLKWDD